MYMHSYTRYTYNADVYEHYFECSILVHPVQRLQLSHALTADSIANLPYCSDLSNRHNVGTLGTHYFDHFSLDASNNKIAKVS